ncbi:MAG: hypothetical protein U0835_15555 [Isosphaeraceae bacterium]
MTWEHLKAFLWLRWRLLSNQWARAGTFSQILLTILAVLAVLTAVPLFVGSLIGGIYLIPKAKPTHLMFAWDAVVCAFLFFWSLGLLTELQRSEPLALSKFLHLPVSANGAFLINYVSSLARLSLVVFGPVMLGFALALVWVQGLRQWAAVPLLAAFFLMVTGVTYQLQGWLASLMSNPRRRRTIIMALSGLFVVVSQLPNLMNFANINRDTRRAAELRRETAETNELTREMNEGKLAPKEFQKRLEEAQQKRTADRRRANEESLARWERNLWYVNLALPPGWLPIGMRGSADWQFLPALLGTAGMALIGAASLRRAYRGTVGLYQGKATAGARRAPASVKASAPRPAWPERGLLVEAKPPGLSEPVASVALAGLRTLLRAPEAKMMLLTPLIGSLFLGSLLYSNRHSVTAPMRPLVGMGAMLFVLFGVMQLMVNQFGFDRDGFRVYVLSSARRRDILMGKNLAFAPPALALALGLLLIVEVICPLRFDHLVAMVPQYVTMFLLFCLFANVTSIFTPSFIPAGTLRSANTDLKAGLFQVVLFLVLFPLSQAVAFLPLGVEWGLRLLGWEMTPVFLLLSLAECAVIVLVYYAVIGWQGNLLQEREQKILERVTRRVT